MTALWSAPLQADLAVVGGGVVGLGIADEARRRGLRVVLVDQEDRPTGASVRNFGHGCLTAQSGVALAYAAVARERWLTLRDEAGIWVGETGTVVVARAEDERAVLEEFAQLRGDQTVQLLSSDQVRERVPVSGQDLRGGALLPRDVRIDPRQAVPALATYLAGNGVDLRWSTAAVGVEPGLLRTNRGDIHADAIVVATGHDLQRLFPAVAETAGMRRSTLQMLRLAVPGGLTITPAVLTGTSLLRYSGFATCPSLADVRHRLETTRPELVTHAVNHMLTQLPSGDLLVGDTHRYEVSPAPFADEDLDELLLAETRRLLGRDDLVVRQRWLGTYAWAPGTEYVAATPMAGVRTVSVVSGIGMTTAFGLAAAVVDDLFSPVLAAAQLS